MAFQWYFLLRRVLFFSSWTVNSSTRFRTGNFSTGSPETELKIVMLLHVDLAYRVYFVTIAEATDDWDIDYKFEIDVEIRTIRIFSSI